MRITVVSKQPPGGRCSLYLRFAEVLRGRLGGEVEVRNCVGEAVLPPPALLIGDRLVAPSDGVIVAPQDIATALAERLPAAGVAALARDLDAALERWMEEWSDA